MRENLGFNIDSFIGSEDFFNYPEVSEDSIQAPSLEKILENESVDPQENNMKILDYLVSFSTKSQNYCVGVVDMVDSTKISATIGPIRISRYYQIFLNSMSKILSKFGGFVIKNVGDCLFYYFPESSKPKRKFGFLSCLEGSLAMVESRDYICEKLKKEGLPCVNYRISADYGPVAIMKANNSHSVDLIGTPVNMCSKINHSALPNNVVIGGDLYETVKHFQDYSMKQVKGYSVGFKYSYPIYSVTRKFSS